MNSDFFDKTSVIKKNINCINDFSQLFHNKKYVLKKIDTNLLLTFNFKSKTMVSQNFLMQLPVTSASIFSTAFQVHDLPSLSLIIESSIEVMKNAWRCYYFEPFFCGLLKLNSDNFVLNSQKALAAGSFYADMILTKELRLLFKNSEMVPFRTHIRSVIFHPYRAIELNSSGFNNSLKKYIKIFTSLKKNLNNNSFNALFYRFYEDEIHKNNEFFKKILKLNIIDEFFIRFCSKESIPSIFSFKQLDSIKSSGYDEHLKTPLYRSVSYLNRLKPVDLKRIALRRSLQSKALQALVLKQYVAQKNISPSSSSLRETLLLGLENYIFTSECILEDLCSGKNVNSIYALLRKNDQKYDKDVYRYIKEYKLVGVTDLKDKNYFINEIKSRVSTAEDIFRKVNALHDLNCLKENKKNLDDFLVTASDCFWNIQFSDFRPIRNQYFSL